ncbi:hypothetical protein SCHPADRAFT_911304 [Schizopora paradoxa]|uniref:DDE Tnp4 domain-containing protein n=1 Tax=Schizopora paradoxa TaxID=27342 RepID=A0A0H2RJR2_9AGAM|nr:hypothetical protein SCHPADRAFT_911304 [Schizopora paradoxa]
MLRIRSEHAIGFLKGRFQSLKNLRINIRDESSHKFATYWVLACTAVHSFAMQCEADEKDSDDSDEDFNTWDFIQAGLSSGSSSERETAPMPEYRGEDRGGLADGRLWRETLKRKLFEAKERNRSQRERVRQRYGMTVDTDGDTSSASN